MAELLKYLITFVLSGLPISEVRGGVIFGVAAGLNPWAVLLLSLIGNILSVPVVFWVLRQAHFREWIFKIFHKSAASHIDKHKDKFELYKELALFAFVAVPLPLTGSYTGILISEVLGWDWKKSLIAIAAGIIVAGTIVFLGAEGIIKLINL
jgi:uncharacterized membrane protein